MAATRDEEAGQVLPARRCDEPLPAPPPAEQLQVSSSATLTLEGQARGVAESGRGLFF